MLFPTLLVYYDFSMMARIDVWLMTFGHGMVMVMPTFMASLCFFLLH